LKIKISEKDLLNCYRLHGKITKNHIILLGGLIIAAIVIASQSGLMALVYAVAGSVGGLLGIVVYYTLIMPFKSKKIYRQQKSLHTGFELTLTEHAINITSANACVTTPWHEFHQYKQNKGYVLLYHSDVLFLMLPKQQLTDELNTTLQSHLGKIPRQ